MPKEILHTSLPSYDDIIMKNTIERLDKAKEMRDLYKAQWKAESQARVYDKDVLRMEIKALRDRNQNTAASRDHFKKSLDCCRQAHEEDKTEFSECLSRVDNNLRTVKLQRQRAHLIAKAGWVGFYILAAVIIVHTILS